MGLFDDLIKKSSGTQTGGAGQSGSTGQGGGNPPQDPLQTVVVSEESVLSSSGITTAQQGPVVIEKTEEQSIMTEKPITISPTLPDAPKPIESPVDDGSFLIVGDNPQKEEVPQVVQIAEVQTPVQSSPQTIETAPVMEAPAVQETVSLTNTTGTQSLREIQLGRMTMESSTAPVSAQDEAMLDNLFGSSTETVTAQVPEVVVEQPAAVPTAIPEAPAEMAVLVQGEKFESPETFIEASIKKIDDMIAHIEETHRVKLEEATGYKAEKERNASLEEECYRDAEKMMKEKAHSEKMKKYFISQKDATESDNQNSTIETTLTTLAVKNSVDNTTDHDGKKNSRKKADSHVIDV